MRSDPSAQIWQHSAREASLRLLERPCPSWHQQQMQLEYVPDKGHARQTQACLLHRKGRDRKQWRWNRSFMIETFRFRWLGMHLDCYIGLWMIRQAYAFILWWGRSRSPLYLPRNYSQASTVPSPNFTVNVIQRIHLSSKFSDSHAARVTELSTRLLSISWSTTLAKNRRHSAGSKNRTTAKRAAQLGS